MNTGKTSDDKIKNAAFIAPNATVVGDVTLGKDTGIWFGAVLRADRDSITIGDGSNVQDNCVVHESEGKPVVIGEKVTIGHGAVIHGCTIKDRVPFSFLHLDNQVSLNKFPTHHYSETVLEKVTNDLLIDMSNSFI